MKNTGLKQNYIKNTTKKENYRKYSFTDISTYIAILMSFHFSV